MIDAGITSRAKAAVVTIRIGGATTSHSAGIGADVSRAYCPDAVNLPGLGIAANCAQGAQLEPNGCYRTYGSTCEKTQREIPSRKITHPSKIAVALTRKLYASAWEKGRPIG
jgi:hypothetical protein